MNASLAGSAPAQRKRRADWLDAQLAPVRTLHRRSLACTVLAGWLLWPQAWAIATIGQAVFIERTGPAALAGPFAVLLIAMLLRVLLTRLAHGAAGSVAEEVKLRLRRRLAERALAYGPPWLRGRAQGALVDPPMGPCAAPGCLYAV